MKLSIVIVSFMLLLKRSIVLADCDPTNQPQNYCCPSTLGHVTIASGVTSIPDYAFSIPGIRGCSTLASITIPDTVTTIGVHAFTDCYQLSSVDLGQGVQTLNTAAFFTLWFSY